MKYKKNATNEYGNTNESTMPIDWSISRIGEKFAVKAGATPFRQVNAYFSGDIPWVKTMDLNNGLINKTEEKITIKAIKETTLSYVLPNSILIAMYGGYNQIGRTGLVQEKCTTNQAISSFYIIPEQDSAIYILNYLNFKRSEWKKFACSSRKDPNITKNDVENFLLLLPPLPEQQKIAAILSTWDKVIDLKEQLIEQKKVQKRGLMNKLLTGELRLPGFEGDWQEVRIGSHGETFTGLNGKTSIDFGFGKPYIPYKNIFANSKINIDYMDYVNIDEDENQVRVKRGDIFFTTSSETPEEVGICSVLLDDVEEMYLNSFCFGYRMNNNSKLLTEFLRFFFRNNAFRKKMIPLAQGSTRFNISKGQVMKLNISVPNKDEQQAISNILGKQDKEIDLLQQELSALKLQKKGLMQLLLTGIVRVKV